MKRGILTLLSGLIVGSALLAAVGDATADAPGPVGAHRHYKLAANGDKVYVGPNFCDVDAAAQGFYGFHHKVHVTQPGINNISSEGCS